MDKQKFDLLSINNTNIDKNSLITIFVTPFNENKLATKILFKGSDIFNELDKEKELI